MSAWQRTNYRGRPVDLRYGAALAGWLTVGSALASQGRRRVGSLAAVGLAGVAGLIDDHWGDGGDRGLAGHLKQLRQGRITTGSLKIVAITAGALAAAASELPSGTEPSNKVARLALDTVLVAGLANLINLLDLRPGRALKAAAIPAAAAVGGQGRAMAVVTLSGIATALPSDLAERSMLGDCGAGALGAAAGVALMRSWPNRLKAVAGMGLVGLTLASEKVSFSAVIDRTGWLRRLDQLGRTT